MRISRAGAPRLIGRGPCRVTGLSIRWLDQVLETQLHSVEIASLVEQVLAGGESASLTWQVIADLPARDRERVLTELAGSEDDGSAPAVSLDAIAAAGIEPLPAADTARHTRHSDPRDVPVVALAAALVDGGERAARDAGGIHPAIWRAMTVGTVTITADGDRAPRVHATYHRGQFVATRVAMAAGIIEAGERLTADLRVQVNAAIARLIRAAQQHAARVITAASATHDAPAVRDFHAVTCRCTHCVARRRARRSGAAAISYGLEFAPAVDPSTGDLVGLTHEQVAALYEYRAVRASQTQQRAHLPSADERAAEHAAQVERGAELARLIDERRAARRASTAPAVTPAALLTALLG